MRNGSHAPTALSPHSPPVCRNGILAWLGCILAVFAMLSLASPAPARGEESRGSQDPDRLMLRAGWSYIFAADATLTLPAVPGLGTTIDFQDTLGASDNYSGIRVDSLFRFNRRHSVGLSWYRLSLAGQQALDEEITIYDKTVTAGANANSSLGLNLWRLLYNWSFYHSDRMEVALSPGMYVANIKLDFAAQGTITDTSGGLFAQTINTERLTLPLPSIGGLVNYDITRKLLAQVRSDFFYLKFGEYEGSMFEIYLGLEYRLFKHFAVGAAFNRLAVDFAADTKDGLRTDLAYNQLYLYGTLYAFDTPL